MADILEAIESADSCGAWWAKRYAVWLNLTEGDSIMHLEAALEIERLRAALIEAEAGLIFAGADVEPAGDFVPSPTAALRIVRTALLRPNAPQSPAA